MFVDIESIRDQFPFDPFKAIVAPRPIGWISTISASGIPNLAPYSFFNALSSDPHLIGFSSSGWKDTVSNCDATGEFVFNLVTQTLLTSMSQSSAAIPPDESEFANFVGLSQRHRIAWPLHELLRVPQHLNVAWSKSGNFRDSTVCPARAGSPSVK